VRRCGAKITAWFGCRGTPPRSACCDRTTHISRSAFLHDATIRKTRNCQGPRLRALDSSGNPRRRVRTVKGDDQGSARLLACSCFRNAIRRTRFRSFHRARHHGVPVLLSVPTPKVIAPPRGNEAEPVTAAAILTAHGSILRSSGSAENRLPALHKIGGYSTDIPVGQRLTQIPKKIIVKVSGGRVVIANAALL